MASVGFNMNRLVPMYGFSRDQIVAKSDYCSYILYKEDCFRVRINGLYSGKVHPNKGLKQGCPLSPVLFGLYLADLGTLLKHSKEGVLIHGQTISGLLFADDLVLIARTRDGSVVTARPTSNNMA